MRESPLTTPEPLAYLSGRWLPLSQAGVGVFDVGLLQGVTIAEQLRTFRGKLFRLDLHLERLARSLEIVGIRPDLPLAELGQIATELAEQNRKLLDPADDQGVTIFVTPGPMAAFANLAGQRGPTIGIHTQPLPFGQWAEKYRTGESLVVTEVMQVPAACWPAELKCRSRMHYYLADRKARAIEPSSRALLLDEHGFVTEASTANILIYLDGAGLVSPPKEHILPGVTVAVVEELAAQLGIPFSHRDLSVDDVARAEEALLCSTSPCVWSVTRLNGQPIGDGKPGPIAARLRATWSEMVGFDIEEQTRRFSSR
jgi:branched-subunit amino acid aminotransferase/4-amino-4-deoxychorismate lyase